MGPCAKFLNVLIIHDHPGRRLWFSPHLYISELLGEWNLSSCRSVSTPFSSTLPDSSSIPPNSLPDISDMDLLPQYQRLVGCLLYLAISSHPDIAYYVMWLGQHNAHPTRAHFLHAQSRLSTWSRSLLLPSTSPLTQGKYAGTMWVSVPHSLEYLTLPHTFQADPSGIRPNSEQNGRNGRNDMSVRAHPNFTRTRNIPTKFRPNHSDPLGSHSDQIPSRF